MRSFALLAALSALVYLAGRRRPLRRRVEPTLPRQARNVAVAALGAIAVHLVERPIVEPIARRVDRGSLGLLPALGLPRAAESVAAFILLDYTLFLWHVLVHRVPWLWRFHQVHHLDLDLDASTAVRFHFGELAISAPWRAAQVRLIGVRPDVLHAWQQLVLASIVFHHSNTRLPPWCERLLSTLIVTPRLHGIHHSSRGDDMNSNWSSGLSLWDALHGTRRTDVAQEALRIGVEGYEDPSELTFSRLLAMPFASAQARVRDAAPGTPSTSR
jgi:sterol desaturase/sphingolipid hydroxylase (fatty acid hydroxylase superfamily)